MRWALVHRVQRPGVRRRANVLRLVLEDVPDNLSSPVILRALEAAGVGPRFGEGGVPFANHALLREGRWPTAWDAGPVPGVWTWEQLTGPQAARRVGLRLTPEQWAVVTTAARETGLSVQQWAVAAMLLEAGAKKLLAYAMAGQGGADA